MAITTTICQTAAQITSGGGSVINNTDGTISVFINASGGLKPFPLTKPCCENLGIAGAYFDIDEQKCRWVTPSVASRCSLDSVFKLVLNPKGNDGSIFYVDGDEDCYLTVDFDYLFKFDCNSLNKLLTTTGGGTTGGGVSGGVLVVQPFNPILPVFPIIPTTPVAPLNPLNPPIGGGVITPTIIQQQGVRCQQLQNQLSTLQAQLPTTFYSIVCNTSSVSPTFTTPTTGAGFGNTGFGFGGGITPSVGLTPSFSSSSSSSGPSTPSGQIYCLTEPAGLDKWASILGPVNYQKFLNGDPTSYTCADVQNIFTLNERIINTNLNANPKIPLYLTPCTTPFGTKTNLLKNIQTTTQQLTDCMSTQTTLSAFTPTSPLVTIVPTIGFTGSVGGSTPTPIPSPSVSGICTSPIQALENLDISFTLEVVNSSPSGDTLETIYETPLFPMIGSGNLYNYITTHSGSTGLYVCGNPVSGDPANLVGCSPMNFNSPSTSNVYTCNQLQAILQNELFLESGLPNTQSGHTTFTKTVGNNPFISQWLHYKSVITDPAILADIKNKKIKISLKVNNACVDFCVLLDSIQLDKVCSLVDRNDIFVSKSPGFQLDKIRDNKKSWVNNTSLTHREFDITRFDGSNPIRQTDYFTNDERLVINTKEIDLDISLASAIETDVWCYISDNTCALTGSSISCPCDTLSSVTVTAITSSTVTNTGTTAYTSPNISQAFGGSGTLSLAFTTPGFTASSFTISISATTFNDALSAATAIVNSSGFTTPYSADPTVRSFIYAPLGYGTIPNLSWSVVVSGTYVVGSPYIVFFNHGTYSSTTTTTGVTTSSTTISIPNICCGDSNVDYTELLTQPLSAITVVEDFEYFMTSELIDAKDRKTLSAYPTLRGVYDRYLNNSGRCDTVSSKFDYETMDQFSKLVGNFWTDLIEQVVPATTIWGSTKIYSNTIFDGQKFKYKSYSLLLGGNTFSGYTLPSPTTACTIGVSAVTISIGNTNANNTHNYSKVCIAQMNSGSEFIGTVAVVGNGTSIGVSLPFNPNYQVINAP